MNFRTEAMMSGSSVMTTASSAKAEFSEAFAEPITARRLVTITFACRVGDDSTRTPLVHVVGEGGGGGGMRPDRSLGRVDDQQVTGAQGKQLGCVLAEVGDRRMAGAAGADRAGDVWPRARPVEGGPHTN